MILRKPQMEKKITNPQNLFVIECNIAKNNETIIDINIKLDINFLIKLTIIKIIIVSIKGETTIIPNTSIRPKISEGLDLSIKSKNNIIILIDINANKNAKNIDFII